MPAEVTLCLTPAFALRLVPAGGDEPALDRANSERIAAAFERGTGEGLLHLGAVEVESALPPTFAFFRDLGRRFLTRLCSAPDLEAQRDQLELPCPLVDLHVWAEGAPPFAGAEYLSDEAIPQLWTSLLAAFQVAIAAHEGTVESWLRARSPLWHLVGRVHLHLAENKSDPSKPFAFLATYTTKISAAAKVQHLPLGRALATFANDRDALLALLAPVERAAAASPLIRRLFDSREIFKRLDWDASEALRFLHETTALEAAGVVVKVPEWWAASARPVVRAKVGSRGPGPGGIGLDALLDFSLDIALDGAPLTEEEIARIRAAGSGLVPLRGRWVEVDASRLDEMMARLRAVKDDLGEGGLTLREAMRMLARGGEVSGDGEWAAVEAGPWLGRTLEQLRRPETLAEVPFGQYLNATLRPYQSTGVKWLHFLLQLGLGACLADDMGLGKTVQVIALLVARRRGSAGQGTSAPRLPDLLLVPASLIGNWTSELARFAPSLRTVVAHPSALPVNKLLSAPPVDEADLVITTYGSLRRYSWLAEREWGLVIADEAQAIKNAGAQQSRAVKALRARGRIALTGTPVENRLSELHSLFEFLNPGLLGSRRAFDSAVKKMAADSVRGHAPLRELIAPYILRRLKSDKRVISDLPDKTELRAFCTLAPLQATLYQQAVDELARELKQKNSTDGVERRGLVLAALMRFKQICNHPSQLQGDGRYAPEASGKHARLMEIAEAAFARQEKLLVFTQFREMTQPLAAWLAECAGRGGLVLHGETLVKERKKLVDRFQADDAIPFMVLSLKAGGTGLNLTAASHVVHFDRWWNPAVEDQATDRAYRIGQHKNVLVHKFIVRGTLEEKIDALIERKRAVAGEVIGSAGGDGAAALLTSMGDAELLAAVSLDLDRAMGD